MINKNKAFDKSIKPRLLKNGFSIDSSWEYGPIYGWSNSSDYYELRLMYHVFGYWIILHAHFGGEKKEMNIGTSNDFDEIMRLKEALESLQ